MVSQTGKYQDLLHTCLIGEQNRVSYLIWKEIKVSKETAIIACEIVGVASYSDVSEVYKRNNNGL